MCRVDRLPRHTQLRYVGKLHSGPRTWDRRDFLLSDIVSEARDVYKYINKLTIKRMKHAVVYTRAYVARLVKSIKKKKIIVRAYKNAIIA